MLYVALMGVLTPVSTLTEVNFEKLTLFNDLTRDSIANNFVIDVYCRCLQILYKIAFFYKI